MQNHNHQSAALATDETSGAQIDVQARRRKLETYGWWMVAIITLGGVINYLDRSTLSIGNTTIQGQLGFTTIQMGLLLSAFSWPYALANLPGGFLIDRFGPKKVFLGCLAGWSIVAVLTGFVSNFVSFYIARVFLGIAEAPFFAAGLKAAQYWFNAKDRSMPVSVINTGSQIGNAIGPPLLTALLVTFSWRTMFIIVGVAGLVVAILWWFFYRDPSEAEEKIIMSGSEEEDEAETPAKSKHAVREWLSLWKLPNTWYMTIGCFMIFYTVWVYITWLPGYLEKARGLSLKGTGWAAAVPYIFGILGVLFGGWISKRFITRGMKPIVARKIPIVGGAVLSACAVATIAYVDSFGLSMVLLCIGYFGAQVPIGCIWTLAADVADSNQVASLGSIQNFGGFLGAAVAPIVTSYILTKTGGSFNLVFVVGAIALILGAFFYGVMVKDRRTASVTGK